MQLPYSSGDPRNEDERTVVVVLYDESTEDTNRIKENAGQVIDPSYVNADENWFLNHPNKWWRLRDLYKGELATCLKQAVGTLQKEVLKLSEIYEQTDPSEKLRFKMLISVFEPTYAYMLMLGREEFNDFAHLRLGADGVFTPVDVKGILEEITKARAKAPRNPYGFWNGLSRNCFVCQKPFFSGEIVITIVEPVTKKTTTKDCHLECGRALPAMRGKPNIFLHDVYRSSHINKWPSGVKNRFLRNVKAINYLNRAEKAGVTDEEIRASASHDGMRMLIDALDSLISEK